MKLITFLTVVALAQSLHAVNWNGNNWALKCDFPGNDLKSVQAQGEQCGSLCASTGGCSHWSWTTMNGGTCWLKQGAVSKQNAIDNNDWSSSCGIIEGSTGPVTDRPVTDKPTNTDKPTVSDGSALGKFTNCRFAYGRSFDYDLDYAGFDYVTIWMDTPQENCQGPSCTDWNQYYQGEMLNQCKKFNKIPVFYAYVIPFEARLAWGLKDCNMGYPNMCQQGAKYIRENRARIIERYDHHSKAIAGVMGKDAFVVFNIEPDFHQYTEHSQEGGPMSGQDLRRLFDDMVGAIKNNLPNAAISFDISPWIGEGGFQSWWSNFASSPHINFMSTSGGGSKADNHQIIPGELSWSFVNRVTGKKIIADTGYGVGGAADDNSGPWYQSWNIDSRVNDGVIGVSIADAKRAPNYMKPIC